MFVRHYCWLCFRMYMYTYSCIRLYNKYRCFWWRCLELKLENFQFLPKRFPSVAMSRSSRVRFRHFVAWNIHAVVFFPISLSKCFWYCFVCPYVVCAVTGLCNKSFFTLFNAVLKSSCWCIHAIFNAGELLFSIFSSHIKSIYVIFQM